MSTEEIDYLKRKNDAWRPGHLQLGIPGIEPESQQRPYCSPHLSVGFLFLILYPAPAPRPPPSPLPVTHTQLCHTPSFTHNFVTHLFVTHLFVAHRTGSFTHSFVTRKFLTHLFVTHVSHTTLSQALSDICTLFVWQAWHL